MAPFVVPLIAAGAGLLSGALNLVGIGIQGREQRRTIEAQKRAREELLRAQTEAQLKILAEQRKLEKERLRASLLRNYLSPQQPNFLPFLALIAVVMIIIWFLR